MKTGGGGWRRGPRGRTSALFCIQPVARLRFRAGLLEISMVGDNRNFFITGSIVRGMRIPSRECRCQLDCLDGVDVT